MTTENLTRLALVGGNLDEVKRSLLRVSQITREIEEHPWRVWRNRRLIRQAQQLLRDNWQVLAVNDGLLPPGKNDRGWWYG